MTKMNDYNFFSSFQRNKKLLRKKNRRTYGIFIGLFLIVILFYGSMGARIYYYSDSIKNGKAFLTENQVKLAEIKTNKDATNNLRTYISDINKAIQKINLNNTVTSELLKTIEDTFPSNVSLKDITIKGLQLTLSGSTTNLTGVSELSHNLEETSLFNRVHINSISNDTDSALLEFQIQCELKEVAKS